MYTYKDLQDEVKRRATRDQSGTQFDTAVKNIINTSLFRMSRESPWRVMRRKARIRTIKSYKTGSGAGTFTNNSSSISVTGATFLTDGIQVGRRIKTSGDSTFHIIRKVTAETALNVAQNWSGTSVTDGTYSILGQEQYNLPVQAGHRMFMWHEEYGSPYKMRFLTDQDFFESGAYNTNESIPTHYRMWSEDMVIEQLKEASIITVVSSDTSDTSQKITVFGNVSGYPDFEQITLNGTTDATGSKSFDNIERVVKNASTTGRVTVTANSANTTVAVLPIGDTTAGILYKKIQLYPLPNTAFDINIQYYKDPYRLVSDEDVHELGQDFDEALILLATSKVKGESEIKQGTQTFFSMWQDEMKSLKKTNADKIDWFPRLRRPREGMASDALIHRNLSFRQAGAFFGPRAF